MLISLDLERYRIQEDGGEALQTFRVRELWGRSKTVSFAHLMKAGCALIIKISVQFEVPACSFVRSFVSLVPFKVPAE